MSFVKLETLLLVWCGVVCGSCPHPTPRKASAARPGRGSGAEPRGRGARTDQRVLRMLFDAREAGSFARCLHTPPLVGCRTPTGSGGVGGCAARFGGARLSTRIPRAHVVLLAPASTAREVRS